MKKLLTILMAVGMLSMFAACGSEKSTETETELEFEQESVDSLQVDEVTVISDEVETTEVSSTPVN
jgi:ABC-type glycerol-3-phosphate transport system substrate-binding protein